MTRHQRFSDRFFLLGLGLLCLIVYTLLLAAIAYIRGQVMNPWIFPAAGLLTGITQYFAARALFPENPLKVFGQGLLLIAVTVVSSVWTAGQIYDVSFAGQWYHQQTVRELKTGWNPYLRFLPLPEIQVLPGKNTTACAGPDTLSDTGLITVPDPRYDFINHQPKAIPITQAAIYSLTGKIETGKAINLIACVAAFCLCLAWLYRQEKLSVTKKWLLALYAAGNPLTLLQLPTFSTGGTIAAIVLSLSVCALLIVESTGQYRVFLYSLLLIFCLNTGKAGLVAAALFTAGFLLFLIRKKDYPLLKKMSYATLLAAATGFIFIGFHPYLTNLISEGNPLFAGSAPEVPATVTQPVFPLRAGYITVWLLLLAGLTLTELSRLRPPRMVRGFLYGLFGLGILLSFAGLLTALLQSARATQQVRQLKQLNETVTIGLCPWYEFNSNLVRLTENNIPYNIGKVTGPFVQNIVHSTTRIGTEALLPPLPESVFPEWVEKIPGTAGH